MLIGLEVFEDEDAAELKILVGNIEFVIQIVQEGGEILLALDSGNFKLYGLNTVAIETGIPLGS